MQFVNRAPGWKLFLFLVLATLVMLGGCNGSDSSGSGDSGLFRAAVLAYIYGYAPVQVAKKTYDQTNSTSDPVYAPINELYIDTETSTPDSQLWVSPNVNVVYSSAHLDLSEQPMVLYTPAINDRYFVWQTMDAYTNSFHYIGSRATGGAEGTYAFVGPDWTGELALPAGYQRIDCPQNSAWLVGRHEVAPNDDVDLETVVGLIQESVLLPLDEFISKPAGYVNPIIDHPDETIEDLDIDGLDFFTVLNEWLTANTPPSDDNIMLAELATMGVGPGYTTDFESYSDVEQLEILGGMAAGRLIVVVETYTTGTWYNGWWYDLSDEFGDYGTEYLLRAIVARAGLGANINEEAIYPIRYEGPHDLPLSGDRSYTLTFSADQLPVPVNENGFWSLTMYDRDTGTLVSNSIDRYSLGSQDLGSVVYGGDGSLTIYIQSDDPGGAETNNWLPSPDNGDPFYLIFRAYYPDEEMYSPSDDPDYTIPNLKYKVLATP